MAQYSLNYERPDEPEPRREFIANHRITGKGIYKVYQGDGNYIIEDEDGEEIRPLFDHPLSGMGAGEPANYAPSYPNYGSARFIEPDDHDPISTMRAFREAQLGTDINRYVQKISKAQLLTKAFQSMVVAGLRVNEMGQMMWDNEVVQAPGQLGLKLFQEFDRLKDITSSNCDFLGINDKNPF